MLQNLFTIAGLGVAGYVAYVFATSYAKAEGTGFTRLVNAEKGSATILMQKLGLLVAGITTASGQVVDYIANFLGDPSAAESVKAVIQAYVTPVSVGGVLALYAVVTIWARKRSLGKNSG